MGATGVALGAYASHGLASWATIKQTEYFQLAVTYQLFHALALLAVSTLTIIFDNVFLTVSKIAFVLGIVFFSGSLYLYVFTGTKILGAITPIGGLLLIIAWLSLAIAVIRKNND